MSEKPSPRDIIADFVPHERFGDGYGFADDIIDALAAAGYVVTPDGKDGWGGEPRCSFAAAAGLPHPKVDKADP